MEDSRHPAKGALNLQVQYYAASPCNLAAVAAHRPLCQ